MAFRLFHDFFPECAERETRTIIVLPEANLGVPAGEYGLLEMFCDEPGCDCRRVFFSVFSLTSKRIDAVIAWGWENIEFYSRWMSHSNRQASEYLKGPALNLGSPEADYAPAILALVREILNRDPAFVERIKRHYALFRAGIEADNADAALESMPPPSYEEPVSLLLRLGDLESELDYTAFGVGPEHIGDLIQMATDARLVQAEIEGAEIFAPVHAWHALGQFRAEAAIEPLLGLLRRVDEEDDEWAGTDLPQVLGEIGAAAIPALTAYLQDDSHGPRARIAAGESLKCIAKEYPEAREACVAALTEQLDRFTANNEELNAFLIWWLMDLDAVESAPVMERAFAADAVDSSVVGDWEDVQIALGLLDERITPPPKWGWGSRRGAGPRINTPQVLGKSSAKAKKKRKNQKASRRKNRRK